MGVGAGTDIVFPTRSAVHTDKIAIGACKAVSFVSDAEQSTWLPCGIGVFIFRVCFISGGDDAEILGASYSSRKDT